MSRHPELARAERALVLQARHGRRAVAAGALLACFAPDGSDDFLHIAVPGAADPDDWAPSVRRLLELGPGRVPRLEFMEELHPDLPAALEARGFRTSARAAAMVTTAGDLGRLPDAPVGPPPLDLAEAPRHLGRFLDAQAQAFGMAPGSGRLFFDRLRAGLADGSVLAAARLEGDTPVSGATLLVTSEGAELAGVWTSPERRRRGLALGVCRHLLASALDHGVDFVWLSAAPDAAHLYRRLGFRRVGTQVNVEPPAGGGTATP